MRKKLAVKHKEITDIAIGNGAVSIRLFGSVARGDDTKKSDVDFLVEMSKGSTLLNIIAIKQDLEALLGVKVDVVTVPSLSPYFREEVLKEAVNL